MSKILISLLQAAALKYAERCELGHELDAGFDAGEWSSAPRLGELDAHAFLETSGFWRDQDIGETHDWLCHDCDHSQCDGGVDCSCDPARLRVYRHQV